jgi:hypothetical protein
MDPASHQNLTVFKMTEGDNGEYAWRVDQNGKLHIRKDDQSVKEREIKLLFSPIRPSGQGISPFRSQL